MAADSRAARVLHRVGPRLDSSPRSSAAWSDIQQADNT